MSYKRRIKKYIKPLFIGLIVIGTIWHGYAFGQTHSSAVNNLFGSKPNIIHILVDDVGYDDIGCYGANGISTPNIDKLADNGIRFTDFYAPSAVCTPSRAAILTGKYSFKVEGCDFILFPHHTKGADPDKEILISRILGDEGYHTALVGKWHMGSNPRYLPVQHGFNYFFGIPYCNDHGPERNTVEKYGHAWPPIPLMEGNEVVEQPVDLFSLPERFTNKVCEIIEKNRERPFYIHYANIETHTPWYIPDSFRNKSGEGAYGDAVQMMDWSVGKIYEQLAKYKLLENTLIVFSSDNGPLYATTTEFIKCYGEFGRVNVNRERYLRAGKGRPEFEGGNRVPAIFSWKNIIPGGVECTKIAGGMDLYATFAYLGGSTNTILNKIDGKNIMPLLLVGDVAESPHEVFLSFMEQRLYALRKDDWKISIDHLDYVRLFNLRIDPQEKTDLANTYPDKMFELLKIAEEKSKEMGFVLTYR